MHYMIRRRPSPAVVISIAALLVSLGGSAYAVVKINGNDIENRSISGQKLEKDTLTGAEINEAKLGSLPPAPIHTPALQHGWSELGGGWAPAGYFKDKLGEVHLVGAIQDGLTGNGNAPFVLPEGFRPSSLKEYLLACDGLVGSLDVSPNGSVEVYGSSCQSNAELDGISFPAGE
jgi:hypothetical protein